MKDLMAERTDEWLNEMDGRTDSQETVGKDGLMDEINERKKVRKYTIRWMTGINEWLKGYIKEDTWVWTKVEMKKQVMMGYLVACL
jgi:hypothetical protein